MKARGLAVLAAGSFLLGACAGAPDAGRSRMSTEGADPSVATIELRGTFVKFTNFPCHRSDPYVGNEVVLFHGSDGSRSTTTTGNASWIGLPADPAIAPLGQCRQVAPFDVRLPIADRYSVEINDGRLPPLTLARIRADRFRVHLIVGVRPPPAA